MPHRTLWMKITNYDSHIFAISIKYWKNRKKKMGKKCKIHSMHHRRFLQNRRSMKRKNEIKKEKKSSIVWTYYYYDYTFPTFYFAFAFIHRWNWAAEKTWANVPELKTQLYELCVCKYTSYTRFFSFFFFHSLKFFFISQLCVSNEQ